MAAEQLREVASKLKIGEFLPSCFSLCWRLVLFQRTRRRGMESSQGSIERAKSIALNGTDSMLPHQGRLFENLYGWSDSGCLSRRELVRRDDCGSHSCVHRAANRSRRADRGLDICQESAPFVVNSSCSFEEKIDSGYTVTNAI